MILFGYIVVMVQQIGASRVDSPERGADNGEVEQFRENSDVNVTANIERIVGVDLCALIVPSTRISNFPCLFQSWDKDPRIIFRSIVSSTVTDARKRSENLKLCKLAIYCS